MAEVTGTLILRPVASKGTITTTTPTGTSVEECYKLVNEENVDGATTCVYLKANEEVYFYLSNTLIENITNITGATLYIAGNDGAASSSINFNISLTKWSEDSIVSSWTNPLMGEPGDFTPHALSLTSLSTFSEIVNLILSNELGIYFYGNTNTKSSPEISQIYLEVDCTYSIPDDNESSSISFYTKKNGIWGLSTGILYQKNNGFWSKISSENLNIENQFVVEEAIYVPPLEYTSNSNLTYSVTGIGTYSDTELIIPTKYKRVLVTGIGANAFRNQTNLKSVTIPNSIIGIGNYAFYRCTGLSSFIIPNSVSGIGQCAFSDCTGLTSITIPDSVTNIDINAFHGCTGLRSIVISNSVTSISNETFRGCTGLTSISIPDSVTSIGQNAFESCTGLTSITIPDSVTNISGSFRNCTGLTSITIPDSVTNIGAFTFENCTALTSINYTGTQEQWNAITLWQDWNLNTGNYTINYNYVVSTE